MIRQKDLSFQDLNGLSYEQRPEKEVGFISFETYNTNVMDFASALNQKTGIYENMFMVMDSIFATETEIGHWVIDSEVAGMFIDGYDELQPEEMDQMTELLVEKIKEFQSEHIGRVSQGQADVNDRASKDDPAQNLGEIVEALSMRNEFENKLFHIKGTLDGKIGLQTVGLSFYRPGGANSGGFMNMFVKRQGIPANLKQWEPLKLNSKSSAVAMKNSYNDSWGFTSNFLTWFEKKADELSKGGIPASFKDIQKKYPNHIFVKIVTFMKD